MDEQVRKTPEEPKVDPKPPASLGSAQGSRTLMACLAYVLFFIPMITGDAKKDDFVKYHTKQGFALFITCVAIGVLGWAMPFVLWLPVIRLLNLGTLILFIVGIVNAANGKKQPLPVIGSMGDWLKI